MCVCGESDSNKQQQRVVSSAFEKIYKTGAVYVTNFVIYWQELFGITWGACSLSRVWAFSLLTHVHLIHRQLQGETLAGVYVLPK